MAARKPQKTGAVERPANVDRGEVSLHLDGVEMVMRPTQEAILAFEGATGKGLPQLATQGVAGTLTLGEMAQIAAECIRAWGRATNNQGFAGSTAANVAGLILEAPGGMRAAMEPIGGMLAMAYTGEYTAAGKLKAATGTTMNGQPAAA